MSKRFIILHCARHGGLWSSGFGADGYNDCGERPLMEWPYVDLCMVGMLFGKHMR